MSSPAPTAKPRASKGSVVLFWVLVAVFILSSIYYALEDPARFHERKAILANQKLGMIQSGKISFGILKDQVFHRGQLDEFYAQEIQQHLDALLGLGSYERKTFRFTHGTGRWPELGAEMRRLFSAALWTCTFQSQESSIIVTTRKDSMPSWAGLVAQFDKPVAEGNELGRPQAVRAD